VDHGHAARAPLIVARPLSALFVASGLAGLISQVVIVRQMGLVLGNTVEAAALVVALFLLGIGAGGGLAGRTAFTAPLRTYAFLELGIASWTLGVAVALPAIEPLAASLGTWTVGPEGWLEPARSEWVLRGVLAALLVLPGAILMGATLPVVAQDGGAAPATIGRLYAANTLGAALGALVADLVAVPYLGMRGTLLGAGLTDLVVAAVAWFLSARAADARRSAPPVPAPIALMVALALGGFTAMGMEIVWLRFLAGVLGQYRAVFSVLLAVLLASFAGGAALGSRVSSAWARRAFVLGQAGAVVTTVAGLLAFQPEDVLALQIAELPTYVAAGPGLRLALQHAVTLWFALSVVALPAVCMGLSFPIACTLAGSSRPSGALLAAMGLGNVGGSLATGFLLVPQLGTEATVAVLLSLLVVASLVVGARAHPRILAGGTAAAAVALAVLVMLPRDALLWKAFPSGRARPEGVLYVHEGRRGSLVVTGTAEAARLWTNGHPMSSTTPHAQRYMRLLAHVPLLLHDEPADVLVVCFGVGNTAHAASLHRRVRALDIADIDTDILRSAAWFHGSNRDVLHDPRVRVFQEDGRRVLRGTAPGHYDVITLEPPPIAYAGVSALYSREFYTLARSRLGPGGILTEWLPAYQVPEDTVRSILAAFVAVFPDAALLVASGRELILVGSVGPLQIDPAGLDPAGLDGEVAADLRAIGIERAADLALLVAGDGRSLRKASDARPPVTDDWPALELAQASHVLDTTLPAAAYDVGALARLCPDCGALPGVPAELEVLDGLYRSNAFLHFTNYGPGAASTTSVE
jgi:spermidine synthase